MPKKKSKSAKKGSKSKEERKACKESRERSNACHQSMGKAVGEGSQMMLPEEARGLLAKLETGCSLSPAEATAVVRKLALLAGTDVKKNDDDPRGDGDQSLVTKEFGFSDDIRSRFAAMGASDAAVKSSKGEPARQIIRNLFAAGGDLESYLRHGGFGPFATACCLGDARAVERAIEGTAEGSDERTRLLEGRESGMRFTPLLLAIAISKTKSYVCQITGAEEAGMDHVGVVKILLRHGARPDCKELTGKSAAHYGAGCRATAESLKMTDYIIEAAKSCAHFGKRVVLRNLKTVEYNGSTGVLGGFDAETGRRQVTLDTTKKQLSLLPNNIFSSMGDKEVCIYDESKNLLNECDRIGTTSLHEVFLSSLGRVDVAQFLIERNVSVDVEPPCGNSVRKLVYKPTPFGASKMHDVIRKHIVEVEKAKDERCWGCGETGEGLSQCIRCKRALYCSKECQKRHWRVHKSECEALDENHSIQLSRPPAEAQLKIDGKYRRPDGVGVDELFWVKVQCDLMNTGPHMVYDRSRSCKFYVVPGGAGYLELLEKMRGARAFSGTKIFVKAAFDGSGNCRVYPNISSTTKKW